MNPIRTVSCLVAACSLALAATAAAPVLRWNDEALNAIRYSKTPPPIAAAHLATLHAAIYDAVNGTAPAGASYLTAPAPEAAGANADAACASAAHTVLRATFGATANPRLFDDALEEELGAIADSPAKTAGIAWGQRVAKALLAARADAGLTTVVAWTAAGRPGTWRPTPPDFRAPTLPQWPKVRPFALKSGDQFRPPPPPALDSAAYAADFAETHRLGGRLAPERSDYDTQGTVFWADDLGTCTPPGHWNLIAQGIAREQHLSTAESARLFALLNLTLADAGISCWDAKFHYDFWRPETAIREAGLDGNPATVADPGWLPLMTTPSFPEYTSGHSTFSRAGAHLLTRYFGREDFKFETGSDAVPGAIRSFTNFSACADEIGRSRIFGGIHFESANREGQQCGRQVADYVFDHFLRPLAAH